ncbi:hypothetical protein D3C79_734130 [compost metagenome]
MLASVVLAQCLVAAQLPGAQVQAAAQVQVLAAAAATSTAAVLGGRLVVDEGCVDARVPALYGHLPADVAAQGDLWNRYAQAQQRGVEVHLRLRHQAWQVDATRVAGQRHLQGLLAQP